VPEPFDPRGLTEVETKSGRANLLFETKLRGFSPSPEMIGRPRLSGALLGSRAALVLLAAPPGFGKTTLLGEWRELDERPFAWLTLDPSDNDPAILWTGIVEALGRVQPDLGAAAAAALRATHVDVLDALIPLVVHELEALDGELVLVLDDYQAIDNVACHESLAYFVDAKPSRIQLVLSSRADPAIPIAKLRAAGELLELRALDLCFTEDEQAAFLNERLSLGLDPGTLGVLHERTEGWPAGVYLASLSLRATADAAGFVASFGGSNRHVVDYLTEVVLGSLDREQRDFLLETSILESLSVPLCDAVTASEGSADRLAELERANLFLIPLDDRRERYRYHQLFADLLRAQLAQRQPELVPELHRRAYACLIGSGDVDGALRHGLAAGELDSAAGLVAAQWLDYAPAHLGRTQPTMRRLERFPVEAFERDARLALVRAWALCMLGRQEEAEEAFAAAERVEGGRELPDGTLVDDAAAIVRACFPAGNVAGALAAAEEAQVASEGLPVSWRPIVQLALGRARWLAGDREGAVAPLEQAVVSGHRTRRWLLAAAAQARLARIALVEDGLDIGEARARDALLALDVHDLSDQPGAGEVHVAHGAVLARHGRIDEAGDALVRGLARLRQRGDVLEIADAVLVYAPVRRTLDSLASARALVEEARVLLAGCTDPGAVGVELEEVARSLTPAHRRIDGESELTERELEVLRYLAEGLPKRDIGRALFLSYNTIHSHTKSIYQKLRVSSRQAAVERARQLGAL
jgi:LuxR family transcriptional regulator, maltose regulon positive regulatory protein